MSDITAFSDLLQFASFGLETIVQNVVSLPDCLVQMICAYGKMPAEVYELQYKGVQQSARPIGWMTLKQTLALPDMTVAVIAESLLEERIENRFVFYFDEKFWMKIYEEGGSTKLQSGDEWRGVYHWSWARRNDMLRQHIIASEIESLYGTPLAFLQQVRKIWVTRSPSFAIRIIKKNPYDNGLSSVAIDV